MPIPRPLLLPFSALLAAASLNLSCACGGCGPEPPHLCATLKGQFTDESGTPLSGVAVNGDAQNVTDSEGRYHVTVYASLGYSYRIFAQPWDGTHCYTTAFSPSILPWANAVNPDINLQFKATTPGIIDGTITPTAASNQSYTATLEQKLVDGTTEFYVYNRTVDCTLREGASYFRFDGLPAGEYRVSLASYYDANWNTRKASATVNPATLTTGGTTTLDLRF